MAHPAVSAQYFYKTPIGHLKITADETGITEMLFTDEVENDSKASTAAMKDCIQQLDEYFAGTRTAFNIQMNQPGTAFQKQVWKALMNIPFGKTISYLELAKRLGDPKKIRAVGNANGKNRIPIIVPCHRVIGRDGSLVGYAGGLHIKKWLLDFENPAKQQALF